MKINEPTLRTLAAAGSVRELVAQRVRSGSGVAWVLMARIGMEECPLEKQRGGAREFKTLDSVAKLVDELGLAGMVVRLF